MADSWLDWIDPDRKGFWRLDYSWPRYALMLGAFLAVFAGRDALRSALWILDGADLIIHEAGHPIFGLLGIDFLQFAGGTLMQLIMPAAFFVHFLKERQPKSADACLFWIGQNFLWIGRYAADARAQALPLVGGGEHDWTYMLGALGLLRQDIAIGRFFDFIGCVLIALAGYGLYAHSRARQPEASTQESTPPAG